MMLSCLQCVTEWIKVMFFELRNLGSKNKNKKIFRIEDYRLKAFGKPNTYQQILNQDVVGKRLYVNTVGTPGTVGFWPAVGYSCHAFLCRYILH